MSINFYIRSKLPDGLLVFDDFAYDEAIVGYTTNGRIVYDYDKMITELMRYQGWNYDDAIDWIEFNTIRSLPYAGENAPIIMYNLED